MDSDAVKKTIIKQALQATNTANARTLIEVCHPPFLLSLQIPDASLAEHKRKVLRALRPQAGQLPLEQRADVPDVVHGEVHGGVERG
jgi:hypothetical protein